MTSKSTASSQWEHTGRIGDVAIYKRGNSFYLSLWDKKLGKSIRRSSKTSNIRDARAAARDLATEVARKGDRARPKAQDRLSIIAALTEGIERGGRRRLKSQHHLYVGKHFAGYFDTWCKRRGLRYWSQITSRLASDYADSLHKRGLKPKTITHYTAPIVQASRYWSALGDDYRVLVVAHAALGERVNGETDKNFLSCDQLMEAISKARAMDARYALAGLVIGGMAGLRLWEITRIKRADYDAAAGTLVVHGEKAYAMRTIPLIPDVSAFIGSMFATDSNDYLIHKMDGTPGTDATVSKGMRRVLRAAGFTIAPKDAARKTFMNWARSVRGVDSSALQAYTGQAALTIMDRHYVKWTVERMTECVAAPLAAWLTEQRSASDDKCVVLDAVR